MIPTLREAQNVRALVTGLVEAMAPVRTTYEILLVDDDSGDGIDEVAAALRKEGHPVRLIVRTGRRGLSTAVLRGFDEARGRVLVCMDADLSHPPAAVPEMLRALDEPGVEFVLGSRYVPGGGTDERWGLLRRLNSGAATLLARPFTSVKDPMAGLFALPRAVYERAEPLNPIGYKIALELLVKCGRRTVREVPIHFAPRRAGESKLGLAQQWNYLRHIARLGAYECGKLLGRSPRRGSRPGPTCGSRR